VSCENILRLHWMMKLVAMREGVDAVGRLRHIEKNYLQKIEAGRNSLSLNVHHLHES